MRQHVAGHKQSHLSVFAHTFVQQWFRLTCDRHLVRELLAALSAVCPHHAGALLSLRAHQRGLHSLLLQERARRRDRSRALLASRSMAASLQDQSAAHALPALVLALFAHQLAHILPRMAEKRRRILQCDTSNRRLLQPLGIFLNVERQNDTVRHLRLARPAAHCGRDHLQRVVRLPAASIPREQQQRTATH